MRKVTNINPQLADHHQQTSHSKCQVVQMRNGERIEIENNDNNTCQNNEDTQLLSPHSRRLKLIEKIKTEHDLQMSLQNIHNEVFEAELAKYRAAGIRMFLIIISIVYICILSALCKKYTKRHSNRNSYTNDSINSEPVSRKVQKQLDVDKTRNTNQKLHRRHTADMDNPFMINEHSSKKVNNQFSPITGDRITREVQLFRLFTRPTQRGLKYRHR
jgi:hypothetical protein